MNALSKMEMCSGFGQFHTSEVDTLKPDKKLEPYVSVNLAYVRGLIDNPPSVPKEEAQWIIPSSLMSRTFAEQEAKGQFWMLWADIDDNKETGWLPPPMDELEQAVRNLVGESQYEIYSSRSATESNPKARVLIPLSVPLDGSDYVNLQTIFSAKLLALGIETDPAAHRAAQLCYLPNRGSHYEVRSRRNGGWFSPTDVWSVENGLLRQESTEAEFEQQRLIAERAARRATIKAEDAPDTIGAFNLAYGVEDILLRAGYRQRGVTFCRPDSVSGSYAAYVKEGRVYSHSTKDPLYSGQNDGHSHDAFSAFSVLFAGGDRDTALNLAGDKWLKIGDEPWNKVKHREWVEQKKTEVFPKERERPTYLVLDQRRKIAGRDYVPGVYFCGLAKQKADKPQSLFEQWICSPLHVEAITFDGHGNNFGRMLRFRNSLGHWREWAMPMELLRSYGDELRGELLSMGVELDPEEARHHLPRYLQRKTPERKMRCALQVGWSGDSFVLPDTVIGPSASEVIFQSGETAHDEHTIAGTLEGWINGIGSKAVGNPILALAISVAFAGPLLARCSVESGGAHLVGDSSTGKTTAIEAACSVWGGPNYKRSWRATANGMEGAAAMFNDCLLALDEISECDPKEVGAIVYALGNGRGKQRAGRTGNARGVTRWRCFVLSSGERSVGTAMAEGGHRAKAGQSVRLLDIPVARLFGAWDELHGVASAALFSDAIKQAAAKHHGVAGRAFLEKLTLEQRDLAAMFDEIKSCPGFDVEHGEGQDKRAAARFAIVALAGELATEYGLTGWGEGDATSAAVEGLRLWRSQRGKGNDERRQITEQVSSFLDRHGDGRFSATNDQTSVRERAGWWRTVELPGRSDARQFLFTSDGMREALKGFDFKRALDVLEEVGAMPPPRTNGERAQQIRIDGRQLKLYVIDPEKLEV